MSAFYNEYVCGREALGKVLGSRATIHLAYCCMFEPDILFVRKERLEMLKEKQLEGAADMVVEILSEWSRDYELREKRQVYQEARIGEIWFIDA
ncbi:MAG TPA: Uma2 family endonuclease [Deltaproteobacteria bacterium]|nr:Uma2 family endonuclease [Deltaproteobacteria bacterium]